MTLRSRLPVLLAFFLLAPSMCIADYAVRPGFGVVCFHNAMPVLSAPPGHAPGDWEWRPLFVSNNSIFAMPAQPALLGRANYWFSTSSWKSRLTTSLPWSNAALYVNSTGPSSAFRKYQSTLYSQINGAPIPNPNLVTGYTLDDYYYNRYVGSDTIPANMLPSQWYLDPLQRMVVESAVSSYGHIGSWGLYNNMSQMYQNSPRAGAAMGGAGVGLYVVFLICEYALVISYDNLVKDLHAQAELYRSYFAPSEHDYFSLNDPFTGRPIIVRRKVPNYSAPSGVDASLAPARGVIGSFTFNSGEAVAAAGAENTKVKTVTINETFTTASIPFQFALETGNTSGSGGSKASGRFSVRVRAPAAGGAPEQWFEFEAAGVRAGQWIAPWAFVGQKNNTSAWQATKDDGTNTAINFAADGLPELSLNWSGELVIRAGDLGVDRLDRIEFKTAAEASGVGETCKARARVTLQPIFSRNIAEAGPFKTVAAGTTVNFSAETDILPSNASDTTYTWNFADGTTATGKDVSHSFSAPGLYEVLLKTDPQVPTQAPNADLFNDSSKGFSFDTCKVNVTAVPGAVLSTDPAVTFSDFALTATTNTITATWKTNVPTSSQFTWNVLPPDFVGPPAPDQHGSASDASFTTTHRLVLTGRSAATTYYLTVGGTRQGNNTLIYAAHGTGGTAGERTWTLTTPAAGQPAVTITGLPSLVFSNLRFDTTPGSITATWNTDKPATSRVQWAEQASATPTQQVASNTATTSHQLTLSNLTRGRTYYLHVSSTPQNSTSPIFYKLNGSLPWDVTVPLAQATGSRDESQIAVLYATAVPADNTRTTYTANLSQAGKSRLVHRLLSAENPTNSAWVTNSQEPSWTVNTTPSTAYEFAFELQHPDGTVTRSRPWIHTATAPPPPPPPAVAVQVQSFTFTADDGQRISFPEPFTSPPMIITSATVKETAVAACAVDNAATGFRISLRDADNKPVKRATVACLAFVPGEGLPLQGACAQFNDNASITFPTAFSAPPIIVCSAQKNGQAVTAAAVSNRADGFTLRLRDLNGNPVSGAWVQWVAAQPRETKLPDETTLDVRGQVVQANDGYQCNFGTAITPSAVVTASAQGSTGALLVGAVKVSRNNALLSLRDHNGQPAQNVWLQWLCVRKQ